MRLGVGTVSPDERPGQPKHRLDPEGGVDNVQVLQLFAEPVVWCVWCVCGVCVVCVWCVAYY